MASRPRSVLLSRRQWLATGAGALAGCTRLVFQPSRQQMRNPGDLGLDWRDLPLTAADGTKLHAWQLLATPPAKGMILFLHGNAENVSTHVLAAQWLARAGYDVLMPEYRGYGSSEGEPSMAGLHQDATA